MEEKTIRQFVNPPEDLQTQIETANKAFKKIKVRNKGEAYALADKIQEAYPNMVLHCSDIGAKVEGDDHALTYLCIDAKSVEDSLFMVIVHLVAIIKDFSVSTGIPPKLLINMLRKSRPQIDKDVRRLSKTEHVMREE